MPDGPISAVIYPRFQAQTNLTKNALTGKGFADMSYRDRRRHSFHHRYCPFYYLRSLSPFSYYTIAAVSNFSGRHSSVALVPHLLLFRFGPRFLRGILSIDHFFSFFALISFPCERLDQPADQLFRPDTERRDDRDRQRGAARLRI